MAPCQCPVRLEADRGRSTLVLGDAGIDNAGNVVFLVFDFGEKVVVAFFFLVVLHLDILDGDLFIGFDHRHSGFRFGLFLFGGLVLVFARGGDHEGRLLDGLFFLFFGFGLAVFVLVLALLVLGLSRPHHAGIGGRLGLTAAALLVERFRLEGIFAFRAFDRPL